MKRSNEYVSCGSLILVLLSTALSVSADESGPTSGYTYKDDWAVVSAPPPPGPYRAVNIDPRVPGAGTVPPLPMRAPSVEKDIPAEALATPPAAGMPTPSPVETRRPATAVQSPPMSDVRQRAPAPPQGYSYPAQPRYPAQTRHAPPAGAYQGYPNQAPRGYYGSPGYTQGQQQVPPPSVYDAMIRNQQPYGNPSRQGTP